MALVDYSSSSAAETDSDGGQQPSAKRRKAGSSPGPAEAMPPLPAAFHDLYASTVRQSVSDDPSLHQGRKRLTPHVPGNWPSHLYIEWHPSEAQHNTLEELLALAAAELGDGVELHKLMTSDLGAQLPLHISLSRPLSLPTADKDDFLDKVTKSIRGGGQTFAVRPGGLAWYRSPDSERTFLILRVVGEAEPASANAELMRLLKRCNTVSTSFGQPALYQRTHNEAVGSAFHVSIGWTPELDDDEACMRVLGLMKRERFIEVKTWEIAVSAVKAKIGNVVSHIALSPSTTPTSSLLFE